MPELSKLFFIPDCPPVGLDPETGKYRTVPRVKINGKMERCYGVAAFLEPGIVRTYLPAANYGAKQYVLPMWAYTAVGFRGGRYWADGFRIEYNPKWDPRHYDDRKLVSAIRSYRKKHGQGPLLEHLFACATNNHCFAAKESFSEALGSAPACEQGMQLRVLRVSFPPEGPIVHSLSPKDFLQAHRKRGRRSCGETSTIRQRKPLSALGRAAKGNP